MLEFYKDLREVFDCTAARYGLKHITGVFCRDMFGVTKKEFESLYQGEYTDIRLSDTFVKNIQMLGYDFCFYENNMPLKIEDEKGTYLDNCATRIRKETLYILKRFSEKKKSARSIGVAALGIDAKEAKRLSVKNVFAINFEEVFLKKLKDLGFEVRIIKSADK